MEKIFIAVLICLAFALQGCEAFKNYYDEPPTEVMENLATAAAEEAPPAEGGEAKKIDYSIDTTSCSPAPSVQVEYPEAQESEATNAGWTTEVGEGGKVAVDVKKLGEYSVTITITKEGSTAGSLTMALKQVGERVINVCNIVYTGCDGECVGAPSVWNEIERGSITVNQFNDRPSEGAEPAYSASYDITFKGSNVGDQGLTLSGDFAATGFGK